MNSALHETHWLPGVIALGAALLAAVVFLAISRRKHLPVAPPSSAEDLETRYQAMILQLKEHSANQHLEAPEAWAVEQQRLELAAAAVLRERAGIQHDALKSQARAERKAVAQAEATGFWAKNPTLKGALWGAGVVGFFVILGVTLSQESKDRVDGQQITGMPAGGSGAPMQQQPPQQADDVELRTAMQRAERSPDDIEALSAATKLLIERQLFDDAAPMVRRATAIDPFHVPTRIYRAILTAVDGQVLPALDELQHVADTFDDAYEARLYAGLLAMQAEDKERALVQLERYVAEAPVSEQPPNLKMGIAQLRQEISRPPTPMLPSGKP